LYKKILFNDLSVNLEDLSTQLGKATSDYGIKNYRYASGGQ
jgi:hypothetical protein